MNYIMIKRLQELAKAPNVRASLIFRQLSEGRRGATTRMKRPVWLGAQKRLFTC